MNRVRCVEHILVSSVQRAMEVSLLLYIVLRLPEGSLNVVTIKYHCICYPSVFVTTVVLAMAIHRLDMNLCFLVSLTEFDDLIANFPLSQFLLRRRKHPLMVPSSLRLKLFNRL